MTDLKTVAVAPQAAPGARVCHECGGEFVHKSYQQQFCSTAHKAAFQNRQAVQGRAVVALAKAWRASRNRKDDRELGSKALAELCSILDSFNADDREVGRPSPVKYARALLSTGRYVDRKQG